MKSVAVNIILLLIFITINAYSQRQTDQQALLDFAEKKAVEYQELKAEAIEFANAKDIPIIIDSESKYCELQYILNGIPQYYSTENENAAISISTNDIHPGGISGLSLTGAGITPRQWDGGVVLTTHQEFGGRVVMGDGAPTISDHSTHVAGTIMAAGVVSLAKGMAYEANLKAFDWNNDNSEMAIEAAAGALMSNHSYSFIRGWLKDGTNWYWYGNSSVSNTEDYLFGFYNATTQAWDQIAYDASYYLICRGAGNERNDYGPGAGGQHYVWVSGVGWQLSTVTRNPDGGTYGYDCIEALGIAKNILTVAAVEDVIGGYSGPGSVVMSSFSSWGPADDGRIKPDISANGTFLYSSLANSVNDYGSWSGTSMAAPSVTGSLVLLQEHFNSYSEQENFMKAATLKALVIHTADEAGINNGPDYEFGWGLMNTESAAAKITENHQMISVEDEVISELTINSQWIYTRDVYVDGTEPLKVTIVWTDIPGTPVGVQLDPINPMLVNDLDLKIIKGDSTYYPWKLDRNNPSNPATNSGENNVDNVEVVYIENPIAGIYTISVDGNGIPDWPSSQDYSMIISGLEVQEPPSAGYSASITNPSLSDTVFFTDLSLVFPTSWSWTFNGPGNAIYVGGTNANSQNPQVQFDTGGDYTVTLVVSNAYGSDVTIEPYSIHVDGYCETYFADLTGEWISNVSFNTINNSSGSSNYSDFTDISTDADPGSSFDIVVDITVNGIYTDHCMVFIDWNQNYDFNDPGESYDLGQVTGSGTLSSLITVPSNANQGPTRVRVSMKWDSNPDGCDMATYGYGEAEDYTLIIGNEEPIGVYFKTFFEGPFNGTNMDASIIQDLPLTQPFNKPPWNYDGYEGVGAIPEPDIVDWVLIELRDAPTAAEATSATTIARQAGFIASNGWIGDVALYTLVFNVAVNHNLFVVVWHRNHLGIMSNYPFNDYGGIYGYNFTTGEDQVYGGSTGHKELAPGVWGMIGGNGNQNLIIDSNDKTFWEYESGKKGYFDGDYNLDREVNNMDKNDIWLPNEGNSSQVPD